MVKVTFVVTMLDNGKNIKQCLNSILKQKNINKEIVIVGNIKKSDISEYISNNENLIVFTDTEGMTTGAMRNKGLDLATGEYIYFLDSNGFLDEDSVDVMISNSLKLNSDLVIGKSSLYNTKSNTYEFKQVNDTLNKEGCVNGYSNPEIFDDMNIYNKIFKMSFIKDNNIRFGDTIYYDYILFQMCSFLKAKSIYILPRNLYNEFEKLGLDKVKSPNIDERIDINQIYDYQNILKDVLDFQLKNNIQKNVNIITNKYADFIVNRGLKYINIEEDKEELFKKISKSLETIEVLSLKLSKRNKNILNVVKNGDFKKYIEFLENEERLKRKKKNKKQYITYNMFGKIYDLFSKLPIKRNSILFISHSAGMDGNYSYIYDGIKKYNASVSRGKRFKCSFTSTKTSILGKLLMPIKLARSEYIMLSENIPFFQYINKRKETKVIQTWHAAGAFKKFGYSTSYLDGGPNPFENKKMTMHNYYDYATVSSEEVRKHYAEAFNMDIKNVIPVGVPRADFFFDKKKVEETRAKIYNLYPKLKDKKVILYAPTFRGFGKKRKNFDIEFDFNKIAKSISDDYVIALKLHPSVEISNIKIDEGLENKIINISEYSDANDVLTVTDLLISDYSSIIFDYSLLNKPMIFYAYDLEEYRYDRDFYYKYEDFVPGPIATTNDEIIKLINDWNFDLDKVDKFCKKFFVSKDGKNTERFIEKILLNDN